MPRRLVPLSKIKCIMCDELFQPVSTRNNKCSERCRNHWYRREEKIRNDKRSVKLRESHIEKVCRICDKVFLGSKIRVTCSTKCSHDYVNSGIAAKNFKEKWKMVLTPKEPVLTARPITDDVLLFKRDQSITEAIKRFKKKGGTIEVLKPEPAQKTPSVDMEYGGWDWQALCGAGTYSGVADYLDYSKINNNNNRRE